MYPRTPSASSKILVLPSTKTTLFFGTIWNQAEPTPEPSRLRWKSCKKVSIPRLLIIILLKCRGIRNQATAEASWESSRILEGGWGTEGCYARFVDIWQRRFGEPVIGWTYPEARNEQTQPWTRMLQNLVPLLFFYPWYQLHEMQTMDKIATRSC